MNIEEVFSQFKVPPQEFGPIPFWFWNDDLEESELVRQLREFHRAGFGGVLIHPRIGLSHRVGYLSEEYFRLVRLVVDEASKNNRFFGAMGGITSCTKLPKTAGIYWWA